MGLLDNNRVITIPLTGLEGSKFRKITSNDKFDAYQWDGANDIKKQLRVTFRDIYAWSTARTLYIAKGKITDEPTAILINETSFPGLRKNSNNTYPSIVHIIACPCDFVYSNSSYGNVNNFSGKDCRLVVILTNGQIYHNYPSCNDTCDFYDETTAKQGESTTVDEMFYKFAESVIWDLPDRKHPVKTQSGDDATLIANGSYYYNPALPDNNYEFHPALNSPNGYGNTVGFGAVNTVNPMSNGKVLAQRPRLWLNDRDNGICNPFTYLGGYVAENHYTMVGTYQQNNENGAPCRIGVFGTQDGVSWYLMYEFGVWSQRAKSNTTYYAANGVKGVPLAQSGSASSDIYNIMRRTTIMPSEADKEPTTLFEYGIPVNIQSIVGDSHSIVVTTTSAHGFNNGDVVIIDFQSGVTASNRTFDWMVNSSTTTTNGNGNGVLFVASEVTSTTLKLTMYVWSAANNLPAKHVHSLNACKDGVVIGSGEDYAAKGGWIIYNTIMSADDYSHYNVADLSDGYNNVQIRLNSTSTSAARPVGFIVQQEGHKTMCYYGADTYSIPMSADMPEGRTQQFKHNSCGLWKFELKDIDSFNTSAELVYPAKQTCFGFRKVGDVFVFCGQDGTVGISYDLITWYELNVPGNGQAWGQRLCHFGGITYDGKFSVDNLLVQLKK